MALPDLIEIIPLPEPASFHPVTVPGSKSITNRALILAVLSNSSTTLEGALWSEDTQVMVECLRKLGFKIGVEKDPGEFCNRRLTVQGRSGMIPNSGTQSAPLDLFVGNAGTAARFLAALVCLGRGVYRLSGVPRMHERPQIALFRALRQLGYEIQSEKRNDKLPAIIRGTGPRPGKCRVSIVESSQFASALMLCARAGTWSVTVVGKNAEESPYVAMTAELTMRFPAGGGSFPVEPDASSGSYFWAAKFLTLPRAGRPKVPAVKNWPKSRWQVDARFPQFWPLPAEISREGDLGDSIMTAIILAPFGKRAVRFTHLGRLRLQECERVAAMRSELSKCGGEVLEHGDTLHVIPSRLHGAEIETYGDHRVAMSFAILGLKVPGIKIKNPGCVKKTFPNFFEKLGAKPPEGPGATIRNAADGRRLTGSNLFAA